jgi:hypothetical protein
MPAAATIKQTGFLTIISGLPVQLLELASRKKKLHGSKPNAAIDTIATRQLPLRY